MSTSSRLSEPSATLADARARAFVEARLAARSLPAYPGAPPQSLMEAYRIQDDAMRLWPERPIGWKVGRIQPPHDALFGTDRLVGPIFPASLRHAASAAPEIMPVFAGGFAAVEGEIVIVLARDADPGQHSWTTAQAQALVGAVRLGVEIASSPFAGINDHGPLVTISDFGNNHGLILGPELPGGTLESSLTLALETCVDGQRVGQGQASSIPGGPLESLRAALEICAARGRPLRAGDMISTGAVTGVHAVSVGQSAEVVVHNGPVLGVQLIAAAPLPVPNWQAMPTGLV